MNKIFNLLSALAVVVLISLGSCNNGDGGDDGSDDPTPTLTPEQEQAALLVADGTPWTLSASSASDPITLDGVAVADGDWDGFTLTFAGDENGGSFQTTNSASPLVWPGAGTWSFASGGISQILRNDGVTMTLNVTETEITLSFDVEDPGSGRTLGFGGSWIYRLGRS